MIPEIVDWAFERTVEIPTDKFVLATIARRCNKYWAAFPSKAEIARITGFAEVSVTRCIKRLEDGGHLKRVPFVATNGQDQKTGYVLAGCGHPLDALDAAFLAIAFANRKQPGVPLAAKPQHWAGERKGGGSHWSDPPGSHWSDPEGRSAATPRSKEREEDQKGNEDAFGEAGDKSPTPEDPAIAEVRATAPTPPTQASTNEVWIPTQRAWHSNTKRDDNWRAQLAAANIDDLYDAAAQTPEKIFYWSLDQASFRLGVPAGEPIPQRLLPAFRRLSHLYLLRHHAAERDKELMEILQKPLDVTIQAGPRPHLWVDHYEPDVGETKEMFVRRLQSVATGMTVRDLGPWAGEFEDFAPKVWFDCRTAARSSLRVEKLPVVVESVGTRAMQLVIAHYADVEGGWPGQAVPPPARRIPAAIEPPPWAA